MIEILCEICEEVFEGKSTYGENSCPKCGQLYDHDEGQHMILSEDQLRLLREAHNGTGNQEGVERG